MYRFSALSILLLTVTMFSGLQNRLEQHLAREAERFRRQFPSRYRRQPLPRLDGDIFPDAEAAERVEDAWLEEYTPVYQRTLASQLRDIPSIARCQASIQQAIRQLETLRQQSLKQRDVLAVDRLQLMQQMADADEQRLATAGLFAGPRRWFRTGRVSRMLRLCLDLRRQELLHHYQALAMTKIRERLSGVLRRVETLRRNSAAVQDRLANLLTPPHPQYLALDPPQRWSCCWHNSPNSSSRGLARRAKIASGAGRFPNSTPRPANRRPVGCPGPAIPTRGRRTRLIRPAAGGTMPDDASCLSDANLAQSARAACRTAALTGR